MLDNHKYSSAAQLSKAQWKGHIVNMGFGCKLRCRPPQQRRDDSKWEVVYDTGRWPWYRSSIISSHTQRFWPHFTTISCPLGSHHNRDTAIARVVRSVSTSESIINAIRAQVGRGIFPDRGRTKRAVAMLQPAGNLPRRHSCSGNIVCGKTKGSREPSLERSPAFID